MATVPAHGLQYTSSQSTSVTRCLHVPPEIWSVVLHLQNFYIKSVCEISGTKPESISLEAFCISRVPFPRRRPCSPALSGRVRGVWHGAAGRQAALLSPAILFCNVFLGFVFQGIRMKPSTRLKSVIFVLFTLSQ